MKRDLCTRYLHMDSRWQWRFYVLDEVGKLVAMSRSFFTRAEAEAAMNRSRL